MKKKTLSVTAALLGLSLIAPMAVQSVQAAEYESHGQIIFEPNEDPTLPVDPTNPDTENPITPVDPVNPDGPNPGTVGPLSIDFASSLNFGTQKITSKTETYYAESQKFTDAAGAEQEGPNFVQVTDNRGTESGWTLEVQQNGQFETASGKVLDAAQITLNNGVVTTLSMSPAPSVTETSIVMDPDGAPQLVMSAQEGEGAGTYLFGWGSDVASAIESIELEVPGSTTKYADTYNTTFTWLLTDTPTNL